MYYDKNVGMIIYKFMPDMVFTNESKKGQKFMKKKNLAFTLAEVLIVIGIIGVVAALTLPNLNHATGDKETITKVKKAYSNLTEALDRAQAIYGDFDTWDEHNCSSDTCILQRISEFMKVSKNCITDVNAGCWTFGNNGSGTMYNQRGQAFSGTAGHSVFLTPDGSAIRYNNGFLEIDIDGPNKGKSYYGLDIFTFYVKDNQLLAGSGDDYCLGEQDPSFSNLLNNLYNSGFCQAYWIITYDNMDYTKFTDANGTCDNGNVVTESNPSCN